MRQACNYIDYLVDDKRVTHTFILQIKSVIIDYFSTLFTSSYQTGLNDVLNCIIPLVINDINDALCMPYSKLEVKNTLKRMHPHKAPCQNGQNSFFFQNF